MADPELVSKVVTVRQWQTVDGTLDNVASIEQVGGDLATAARARRVREVGWAVLRSHPHAGLGSVGWPPDDSPFEVALPIDDWEFVKTAVAHGCEVSRGLLADPSISDFIRKEQADSIALGKDALGAL